MADQDPVIAQSAEDSLPPSQSAQDESQAANKDKPGSIVAISILSIVLAAMGLLTVLTGVFGLFVGDLMMSRAPVVPMANGKQEIQQLAQDMQTAALTVNRRYRNLIIVGLVGGCVSSIALLFGGIRVLLRGARAYGTLRKAMVIAMVIDVPRVIPTMLPQREMLSVYEEYFARMGDIVGEAQAETMSNVATIGMYVGLFIAIAWILTKVGFYIGSYVILRRHERAANIA